MAIASIEIDLYAILHISIALVWLLMEFIIHGYHRFWKLIYEFTDLLRLFDTKQCIFKIYTSIGSEWYGFTLNQSVIQLVQLIRILNFNYIGLLAVDTFHQLVWLNE